MPIHDTSLSKTFAGSHNGFAKYNFSSMLLNIKRRIDLTTVSIHQDLLLHILYGSPDGRRFTQDTPVLPEVWLQFARDIGKPVKSLIVPRYNHQAHHVAEELHQRIKKFRASRKSSNVEERDGANVADMPGLIWSCRAYVPVSQLI